MTFDEIVATYVQTCMACPTQYEGRLVDGRTFYFRYRSGRASLGVGISFDAAVMDDAEAEDRGDVLQLGDQLHGELTEAEFKQAFVQLWDARGCALTPDPRKRAQQVIVKALQVHIGEQLAPGCAWAIIADLEDAGITFTPAGVPTDEQIRDYLDRHPEAFRDFLTKESGEGSQWLREHLRREARINPVLLRTFLEREERRRRLLRGPW